MKLKIILLFLSLALIASGCLIKSLQPFYKESDVIFDPSILGTWMDHDSVKWNIEQFKTPDLLGGSELKNFYLIRFNIEGEENTQFNVHLFKLNGQLYADFLPINIKVTELTGYHIVPAHSIAKIDLWPDSISLKWFNETWLNSLFDNKIVDIDREIIKGDSDDEGYVLTASTDELQKFIIKYGNDPNAFRDNSEKDKPSEERNEILCFLLKRIN